MIEHILETTCTGDFKSGTWVYLWKAERAREYFSKTGRGVRHMTAKIYGKWSNISSKLFQLETSNLVCSFVFGMLTSWINHFPQKGRGLGHATPKI